MIQLPSDYNRLTEGSKKHIGWKWKYGERYTMQIISKLRASVIKWDNIDFE
jgi:hypothetical protein